MAQESRRDFLRAAAGVGLMAGLKGIESLVKHWEQKPTPTEELSEKLSKISYEDFLLQRAELMRSLEKTDQDTKSDFETVDTYITKAHAKLGNTNKPPTDDELVDMKNEITQALATLIEADKLFAENIEVALKKTDAFLELNTNLDENQKTEIQSWRDQNFLLKTRNLEAKFDQRIQSLTELLGTINDLLEENAKKPRA